MPRKSACFMYNHVPLVSLHGLRKDHLVIKFLFTTRSVKLHLWRMNWNFCTHVLCLQIVFSRKGTTVQYRNTFEGNASLNSFMGSFIASWMKVKRLIDWLFNATGHNKSCCQFAVNKIFIMRWTFSKLQSETKAFQRTCGMNSTNNLSTCGTNCQWYMFVPILFTSVVLKSLKGWMTKRFSVISSESKPYFLHLFIKIHTVKSWL